MHMNFADLREIDFLEAGYIRSLSFTVGVSTLVVRFLTTVDVRF